MSLRLRLAILCAALATCTAAAFGFVSYHSTSNRMTAQVDASLRSAASYLVGGAANFEGEGADRDQTARPPWNDPGPGGPGGILDQVAVQQLNAAGAVLAFHSGPSLPVDSLARQVAAGQLGAVIETSSVGGVAFRVITVGIVGGGAVQVAQSLHQRTAVLRDLRSQFLLLALLVALIGAVIGWLIALHLTRPLERLTDATEEIARTGTTEQPLNTGGRDEVGRLSTSFAGMIDALASSRQQQHQLVRDAGHELRTPITSLRTNIEVLERHDAQLSTAQRSELLGNLRAELEELTQLVDEIVDVATDTAIDDVPQLTDVVALVERVTGQVNRRHGSAITVTSSPYEATLVERTLERAVSNLLENAVKFAGTDATISIEVEPGRIAVTDNGPGVDASDLPKLFDRFYRAESSKSRPGSGLGLSIVASVAEAHDGSVFAEQVDGGGLRIGLLLPRS